MENLFSALQSCKLFNGLPSELIRTALLPCAQLQRYTKGQEIITPHHRVDQLGILVSGKVQIVQCFPDGSQSLMEVLFSGFVLGSDLLYTETRIPPYYAIAAMNTQVLFLPATLLLTPGALPEWAQLCITQRLLTILSNENMRKHYRLAILSERRLRNRILIYLTMQAERLKSDTFCIPFSRDELANFLCVNRSALSHELSLMRKEGLILFRKNEFTLLQARDHQSSWTHFRAEPK